MQTVNLDYQSQIEEASKRAKNKRVFYLYDEQGNRQFLGIFGKIRAQEVRKYLKDNNHISRLVEFDVRTTEPDTPFSMD